MKLVQIIFFFLLLFSFTPFLGQTPASNEKWGTIKIKKIKSNKNLPVLVYKKKPSIRVFRVRFNSSDFKETFPATYQSNLFPLVFNGIGLILTDENKQWSDNTIIGYDYEIFIGNTAAFNMNSASAENLNSCISSLRRGTYMWIKNLYYSDSKGKIHLNEIGEFKIEKLN